MEKVKDLILYQVATDRHYKVGDKITFNKTTQNGQYKKVMESNSIFNNERIFKKLFETAQSKFKKLTKEELFKVAHIIDDYDITLRDLAIEEIRKNHYPNYPSRLHCMYLSSNKQIPIDNFNDFIKYGKGTNYQIVAVKLNGKIFKSGNNIPRLGQSYAFYLEKAKEYWAQTDVETPHEILFEGKAEIVEIIKEVNITK